MANSQYVGGKQRQRPQRHPRSPSPPGLDDWEGRGEALVDSLPYRTRTHDIQRPDSRKPKNNSSSHRRRASEDMRARASIPPPTLTRSATVTHRDGRDSPAFGNHNVHYERRSRMKDRSRSRSRSSGGSSSESYRSESESELTPRSAHVNRSTPDSRRSSRSESSRRTPSVDSNSSVSTHDGEKRPIRQQPKDDIRVIPAPGRTENRTHLRRHREKDIYELESTHKPKPAVPVTPIAGANGASRHRHTRHSDSRSSSRRRHHDRHHHRDHRREVRPSSSSKRSHKKYYEVDRIYLEKPKPSRSHTTSSSHVTSSQSVSTSSKRSSNLISSFIAGAINPPSERSTKLVECVACMDDETPSHKTARLKCGHRMCHSCMKRIFKVSIKDPAHMPPKCCTEDPIPVKHVDRLFDMNFKKTWNSKFAEFSTRNRIYCPSKRCGEWIKPDRIQRLKDGRKLAKCAQCKTEVCCSCNGKWHRSRDCPTDEATNEILQQAKENGWQRCFKCQTMVELKEGCNHMTCRCGAEFCMICGVKWKSCECPWFNYDTVEQDRLNHMQIPTNVRMDRDRIPGSPRDFRTAPPAPPPGLGVRQRPQTHDEEISMRRMQEQTDEELARRLQYDDVEDDYVGRFGDVIGIGNAAGHFMNDDYRRVPQSHIVPPAPPPQPPAAMPAAFERANTTDYVAGVNRARGVRGSSMERRLADRFSETRQGSSPTHRSFSLPIPPPPGPSIGGLRTSQPPPPPPPPPGAPITRRYTEEDDLYNKSSRKRLVDRMVLRRARTDYDDEAANHAPSSRRHPREPEPEPEPARFSVLAGLTGEGRGMNRVYEWRNHVAPGDPDAAATVAG